MKSHVGKNGQPIIADSVLEAFILEVANAEDTKINSDTLFFFSRYPKFFPTREQDIEAMLPYARRKWSTPEGLKREVPEIYHRAITGELRDGLRMVWESKDEMTADWRLFHLQSMVHRIMDKSDAWQDKALQPPPHAPIHQAFHWVRRNISRLKKCANSECDHPFFVGDGKNRFCTPPCAAVAQKIHKRRWWHEHGSEWRQEKAEKQRKQKPVKAKRK